MSQNEANVKNLISGLILPHLAQTWAQIFFPEALPLLEVRHS